MAEIYRHYAPNLARELRRGIRIDAGDRMLRAELGGWFEVEAIVQETFARGFAPAARNSYDGLRPFSGFLHGIARNVLLDEYRRYRRALGRFVPLDNCPGLDVRASDGSRVLPDHQASVSEERALVAEFLASCSDLERAVYHARYEHDLSQEAAADFCHITRMKLRLAEQKLRSRLLKFAKARGFADGCTARSRALGCGGKAATLLW
ncbi:MAG: RNA polymerase sigma factor [Pseudomonadota bacterium]